MLLCQASCIEIADCDVNFSDRSGSPTFVPTAFACESGRKSDCTSCRPRRRSFQDLVSFILSGRARRKRSREALRLPVVLQVLKGDYALS